MKRQARPGPNSGRKKPKDMPRRPLSAYNLYFKQERPLLIARYEQGEKQPDFDANMESAVKAGKDKDKGAVFQAASKTLAERWKTMTVADREPYERQADEELKKYRKQVAEYQQRKESERREEEPSSFVGVPSPSPSSTATEAPLSVLNALQQSYAPDVSARPFAAAAARTPAAVQSQQPPVQQQPRLEQQPTEQQPAAQQQQPPPQQLQQPIDTMVQCLVNAALQANNAPGGSNATASLPGFLRILLQIQSSQLDTSGAQDGARNLSLGLFQQQPNQGFAAPPPPPPPTPLVQSPQAQLGALLASLLVGQLAPQGQTTPQPAPPPRAPTFQAAQAPPPSNAPLIDILQLGEQEKALLRQLLELHQAQQRSGPPP